MLSRPRRLTARMDKRIAIGCAHVGDARWQQNVLRTDLLVYVDADKPVANVFMELLRQGMVVWRR
jgi:hypothetical protein